MSFCIWPTWHYIPEDGKIHNYHCENPKSYVYTENFPEDQKHFHERLEFSDKNYMAQIICFTYLEYNFNLHLRLLNKSIIK
jgi:hypothetical protein